MKSPIFRPSSIILILLSLSIGWGIRGNYGHEYGAMLAGALAGMAAALMSGREDWRQRLPYFAFFGALGWGFGGSIAYMHPPSYTQSGHLPTQVYGFASTYFEAFLWAALGGAGTAYAATEDREKLTAIFRPLTWVFGFWTLQYALQDTPFDLQQRLFAAAGADHDWFRQRDPLYWLDSEWQEALYALTGLCLFDLWDRRFSKFGHLIGFAVVGAGVGYGLQRVLAATGHLDAVLNLFVQPQGDLTLLDPATGLPKFARGESADELAGHLQPAQRAHGLDLRCCGGPVPLLLPLRRVAFRVRPADSHGGVEHARFPGGTGAPVQLALLRSTTAGSGSNRPAAIAGPIPSAAWSACSFTAARPG